MSVPPDSIHRRGRDAVLAGRALIDVPPTPGGTRWGLSLVVRLDPGSEEWLDTVTTEAAGVAGPGQWRTGARGGSHLTVTYLERTWRQVGAEDPAVRRFGALVSALAAQTSGLQWRFTGLALADRSVLALAEPVDDAADRFRVAVLAELDGLGEAEAHYRRSVWWATVLHFAAPLRDPAALADWVDARTALDPVLSTGDRVEVVRYRYDGERTVPVSLVAAPLRGVASGVRGGAQA